MLWNPENEPGPHDERLKPMSVLTASNPAEMDVLPEKLAPLVIELNTHLVSESEKRKGTQGEVEQLQVVLTLPPKVSQHIDSNVCVLP